MFQILAECRKLELQGRRVLHFELGDPDFDTPSLITEGCIQSLKSGNTHYMPARGSEDLIAAVRMTTGVSRGFIPTEKQITITTGANSAIFYAIKSVADPGDEILMPNPYFPSYLAASEIAGVRTTFYNLAPEAGFTPDIGSIEKVINERTKAILINSPSNPTGTVLSEEILREIYKVAERHDIYIISDEVYARMIYNPSKRFFSPGTIDSCKKRTIIINGFSKAFAMTGWRIGVSIAPEEVSSKITLLSESLVSCVPGFVQDGARAAILGPKKTTKEMYEKYRERQINIISQLNSAGLEIKDAPDGAMYVFADIGKYAKNSEKFALHLLKEAGVATVPGIYFGSQGERHLRLSCAGSDDDIEDLGRHFHAAAETYPGE